MPKAYWISSYRSISNPTALAEYAKLAGPAITAGGGRFLARGTPAKTYEAGLAAYEDRNWREAIKLLETAVALRGDVDRPSEILLERSRTYLADSPGNYWMPISVLESKG